jgi:hypothetical protein
VLAAGLLLAAALPVFSAAVNLNTPSGMHELVIYPDHKIAYASVYGDEVYGKNPHPRHIVAIFDSSCRKWWEALMSPLLGASRTSV